MDQELLPRQHSNQDSNALGLCFLNAGAKSVSRKYAVKMKCTAVMACLIFYACGQPNATSAPSNTPPNIVLIFVDDVGYCDTELYGCDAVPTPNIKRLADEGVLFTSGYVTSPVCSPSRAGLLTGRYQHRFGHEFLPEAHPDGNGGLPVTETTLAEVLSDAGYATAVIGKWHLGSQERFHPLNRGFDTFFGILHGVTDYANPTRPDVKVWRHPLAPLQDSRYEWQGRGENVVIKNRQPVIEDQYLTEAFTREAISFLAKQKDRPFFLYLAYTAIHGPLQVTKNYYDRFDNVEDEAKRIYQAQTSALDDGIGKVLEALGTEGLKENTMIIFISDNGAGVADYTNNTPLRLGKHTLFEGGVRVPFAIQWGTILNRGTVYEKPVSTLDIFPTIVAATIGTTSTHATIDGVDLIPFLWKTDQQKPHESLYWRQGSNWAIRHGDWKLIHAAKHDWLYNLADDLSERNNIAQQNPELVERLKKLYFQWNKKNVEPLWPSFGAKDLPGFSVDGIKIQWDL